MSNTPNRAIHCSVDKCQYNCKDECYCSLSQVDIGTHEQDPTVCKCVDCNSFTPCK